MRAANLVVAMHPPPRRRVLRLFAGDDHGQGYVDAVTPEVAVAVRDGYRGTGMGGRLLTALADGAAAAGIEKLSLSVDPKNPARHLYEKLGYRELRADEDGILMLLD